MGQGGARRPVVVGVDGSVAASRAAEWAAEFAALRNAPLQVLSAVGRAPEVPARGVAPSGSADEHAREARRVVRETIAAVRRGRPRLDVRLSIPNETAVVALLDASASASTVVVGSRGAGEPTSRLAGSTAVALAARARCPVAVVRGRGPDFPPPSAGPVVVGTEGSAVSEDAIRMAFEEASLRQAGLLVLHSWSEHAEGRGDRRASREDLVASAQELLAEQLAGFERKYPEVSVLRVVTGTRPVSSLLHHSKRAQLLVVGSRGHGGLGGLSLGSASQALVHHAHCPVLAVRPQALR